LRLVGIFEYGTELSNFIDTAKDGVPLHNEIPYSGVWEVEIRANTVVAVG
jgi:hypothetical protein